MREPVCWCKPLAGCMLSNNHLPKHPVGRHPDISGLVRGWGHYRDVAHKSCHLDG